LTDVTDDSVTLEVDEPPPPRTVTLTHDMIGEAKRVVTW
jgi:hypothetical protein